MSRGISGALNQNLGELLERWGTPIDPELLVTALTHRSFAYEQGGLDHNERLEFLGDSVLGLIVTDWIYRHFPSKPESVLSRMRIATVSQAPLAQTARALGLGDFLLLGVGEHKTGGPDKDSILCDALEALIGATYLSTGMEVTRQVVLQALSPLLEEVESLAQTTDWKTRLQEYIASSPYRDYQYQVDASGPDHRRQFAVTVLVDGQPTGRASASSRKHAENLAARDTLVQLVGPEVDPTVSVLPSDR
ncbi:ribonuclease III [Scrofimicrobium sp. R131]|uniref:Ribonuclease 3 n=1 Tax=Scrofimicrobium appendicitidis TaxID=3079930 RepID=A0AAU7V7Q8_9ACTO